MVKKRLDCVQTDLPCRICGSCEAYRSNYQCIECARRRSFERSDDSRRKAAGLKPTVGAKMRKQRRDALEADRALREIAKLSGALKYHSLRPCKRGHRNPERYTVHGGCVKCAAASSQRQYSQVRKG
jgi:hypothetical protein